MKKIATAMLTVFIMSICILLGSCHKKAPNEASVKPARKAIYISRDGISIPSEYDRDSLYYFENTLSYDSTLKSYEIEFEPLKEGEMLGRVFIQRKAGQDSQFYSIDQYGNERGIAIFNGYTWAIFSNDRKRVIFGVFLSEFETTAIFSIDGNAGQMNYLFSLRYPSVFMTDGDMQYFIYESKFMQDWNFQSMHGMHEFIVLRLDDLTFYNIFSLDVKSNQFPSDVYIRRKQDDPFGFRLVYGEEGTGYLEEAYYNVMTKTLQPRAIVAKTVRTEKNYITLFEAGLYPSSEASPRNDMIPMKNKHKQ